MKRHTLRITALGSGLFIALLLICTGCSKGTSNASKYFPAQLEDDDKWGIIDINGKSILEDEWKTPPSMVAEGICYVSKKDGFEYYVVGKDPKNIGQTYSDASGFNEGLAAVVYTKKDKSEIQYIDKKGNIKLSIKKLGGKQIKSASIFNEGMAWVENEDGKYGYINKKGELVIPCKYDSANLFHEGLAKVSKQSDSGTKTGFVNKKGDEVIKLKSDIYYEYFHEGYCTYYTQNDDYERMYGTIGKKGNPVIKASKKIQRIPYFLNGIASFYDGDHWGLMDTKGKTLVRAKYDELIVLPHGIVTKNGDKVGVINAKGKEIFPLTDDYEYVIPLGGGKFAAREGKYDIIIDAKGKEIAKNRFYQVKWDGLLRATGISEDYVYFSLPSVDEESIDDYYGWEEPVPAEYDDYDDYY